MIDAHAAGEPLRVITGGLDAIPGATIIAKRTYAREHLDGVRRGLMFEPRGHADMYGAILTEPVTPDGDFGVLFMHNEGWSTMCGHGIIALTTVAIETGMLPWKDVVLIDAPAGRITARPRRDGVHVASVAFENVPSFVLSLDDEVEVPGLGRIRYDLAFGGAFYAYVDVAQLGLDLSATDYRRIIDAGWRIKSGAWRPARSLTRSSRSSRSCTARSSAGPGQTREVTLATSASSRTARSTDPRRAREYREGSRSSMRVAS